MSFRSLLRSSSLLSFLCLVGAPGVVSAEVLWRGDFETGDLTQFGTALNPTKGDRKNINVVMMPVHGGTRAAEVVIHPDDLWQGNNHNRVELHYDANEARTGEGKTTYFSFYFRLPEHAQTLNDIAYWETANSYQQSMAFWIEPKDGGTQLSFRTNHPSGMTHFSGPVSIDAWHQLAMEILWSENAAMGRVNVWLDGKKVVDDVAAKTKPDANRAFIQMGYHRNQTATPVETIYLDDAIEATTLDEILAAPSSGGSGGAPSSGGMAGASAGAPSAGGAGGAGIGAGGTPVGSGGASAGTSNGSAGQPSGSGGASAGASPGGTSSGGSPSAAGAPTAGSPSAAGSVSVAGAPGSGGRPGSGGAPTGTAGSAPAPSSGDDSGASDDGGGCTVNGNTGSPWPLALLALGAAALRRRRRGA